MNAVDELVRCPLCQHDDADHLAMFTNEVRICIVLGCECTWPRPSPYLFDPNEDNQGDYEDE